MNGTGDLSTHAQARAARRQELRIEIESLQGRRAKSNDPATQAKLDDRIRRAQARLSRA
jgi:hypothetical protein